MKKIRSLFLLISIAFIGACSSPQRSAPIVDHPSSQLVRPVPAEPKIPGKASEEHAYYTVKKNDTLYRIALDLGQNYRDIIAWNNLANPNDIKVDQVLRVLPPETGTVAGGVQTGSVTTGSVITGSVTTGSVSTGSVSSGPGLESHALPASAQASGASGNLVQNKTVPRGDKRPYSEAALADLQKPDAVNPPAAAQVAALAPAAVASTKPVESKGIDKPPEKPVDAHSAANSDDDTVSWMWPADGKIIANFDDGKKGIDIAGQSGQQVVAAGAGKVMYAGSGIRGYGNLVIVKHTGNLLSAYAHNKAILVKEGQMVNKGQKIAEMGNSDAETVALHFEIRQQGKPVDPSKFLPNR